MKNQLFLFILAVVLAGFFFVNKETPEPREFTGDGPEAASRDGGETKTEYDKDWEETVVREYDSRKLYYESGKIKYEAPYENGAFVDGVVRNYYENGKIYSETPFENGKREGVAKAYYENGNLKRETTYKNGKATGTRHYNEDGTPLGD